MPPVFFILFIFVIMWVVVRGIKKAKKPLTLFQICRYIFIYLLVPVLVFLLALASTLAVLPGNKERVYRVSCAGNLKQIANALAYYVDDFGAYPGKLSDIRKADSLSSVQTFKCPSSKKKILSDRELEDVDMVRRFVDNGDYCYVSGLKPEDTLAVRELMLVFDAPDSHPLKYGRGRNVLFTNLGVYWYTEEEFLKLLTEQKEKWKRLCADGKRTITIIGPMAVK